MHLPCAVMSHGARWSRVSCAGERRSSCPIPNDHSATLGLLVQVDILSASRPWPCSCATCVGGRVGLLVRATQSILRPDQQPRGVSCSRGPPQVDWAACHGPYSSPRLTVPRYCWPERFKGRCTAVTEVKSTLHAASTTFWVQAEELSTALAHMRHPPYGLAAPHRWPLKQPLLTP